MSSRAARHKGKFPEDSSRQVVSATVKWYVYRGNLIKSITPRTVPRAGSIIAVDEKRVS